MKTIHTLAFAAAACAVALSYGQQTTTPTTTNNNSRLTPTGRVSSITDNPGILGHQFADVNFGWTDFRNSPAEGYRAGFSTNLPLAPGFDAGLGYDYYWEGKNRDPLTRASSNARNHTLDAMGKFYMPMNGVKPFLAGGVGYNWERGDFQRLRTFGHEWLWRAAAGVEIPFAAFAVTPQVAYDDTMRGGSVGRWSYGAQVHHWFNEQVGAYVDFNYSDPRHGGTDLWTYLGGLRYRF
jgi:hypothetical protein